MKPLSERLKDFPGSQFVEWLCLACVDVREVRTPDEAQEEINKIREAVTERFAMLEDKLRIKQNHIRLRDSYIEELEERAEVAEVKVKELEEEQAEHDQQIATLQGKFDLALAGLRSKTQRCEKAEADLSLMHKQPAIGRVDRGQVSDNNEYPDARVVCLDEQADWENFQDGTELFLRPATATELEELVPDECEPHQSGLYGCKLDMRLKTPDWAEGFNACRSAILRNIEGAK